MKSLLCAAAAAAMLCLSTGAAAQMAKGPHQAMPCTQCHKDAKMSAPSQKTCLECHVSYAEVAKRTASAKVNPHDSHMGRVDCNECHKMHGKSQYICRDCHAFDAVKFKGE